MDDDSEKKKAKGTKKCIVKIIIRRLCLGITKIVCSMIQSIKNKTKIYK